MNALGRIEIDLAALARNYGLLSRVAAPGICGAVVKADAYGLGIEPVARRLHGEGCRHFFVATPAEGVTLRRLLPDGEIFVFGGLQGAGNEDFVACDLQPVLNTRAEIRRWGGTGPAAIQVDTGMNRLGLGKDDIAALKLEAHRLAALDVRYVMTHLACADDPDHALNEAQLEAFEALRAFWPAAATSIGNSAGLLLGERFRSDLARPGIALYGGNPFKREPGPMEPVVTLRARILQLRDVRPGTTIGYGATFVADTDMRVATVGVGYADGYLRSLSNCGIAEVAARRVPVVGRVSMDLTCLDVSAVPRDEVGEGDWATLIGGRVPLEEVAALAGTINYELLTALGSRLERVYREDGPSDEAHS